MTANARRGWFSILLFIALLLVVKLQPGAQPFALAQESTPDAPSDASLGTATPSATTNPTQPPESTEQPVTEASPPAIPQYGLFEADLPIVTSVKNVFDPSQLEVDVQFTAPDGTKVSVPAFWMQPYQQTCSQDCAIELLKPTGPSGWRVRFTPNQPGEWSYIVQERDSISIRTTSSGKFTVTPSDKHGFIQVAKNRHYFSYSDGTPYFAIGPNLGWSWNGANNTLGYQRWLQQLKADGANYARLYIDVPWFIGLGWKSPITDLYNAQDDAWRLDTILKTAEESGIALQLVIVWYQGFTSYNGLPVQVPSTPGRPDMSADWSSNPYNTIVGGPLPGPAQFFALEQAKTLFKRQLRYIAARWGYSTNIFAWEMIDQLDRVSATDFDPVSDWLKEVTAYLRDVDAQKHLITAGVRDYTKANLLDRAVLDFKQVRFYQKRPIETAVDQVSGTLNTLVPLLENADRPILLNDFSLNPWFEPTEDDPTGVHVRETMWATALSGAAGSGSSWWWDTYLFPQKLTEMYAPLAAFMKGVPLNSAALVPVGVSLTGDSNINYAPFRISGFNGTMNGPKAPDITFRVTSDGVLPPVSNTSSFLYGVTYNTKLAQPQTYIITPPVDTMMTIIVNRVSERAGAKLSISIDSKVAGEMTLSPSSQPASLAIPVSAGEHKVVIDNTGADYLQIESITLAQYITPLRTVALADRKAGIFLCWLQNRTYTWENVAQNVDAEAITSDLHIDGMPTGQYRVELWDPFTGNVLGSETIPVTGQANGILTVNLLPISKMLAVRAFRIAEVEESPTSAATP